MSEEPVLPKRRRRIPTVAPVLRKPVESFADALDAAAPRPAVDGSQSEKKNYAERLSRALAIFVANKLRPAFPGIIPDPVGKGQESLARTAKGYKRLDVNYSTLQVGLGLGVSVKTLNFRDPANQRYTKNYTRIDNELRAEASDYHNPQPFCVLVGLVFLPIDCCDDGSRARSSFAQAIEIFRPRSLREKTQNQAEMFEAIYIGLYDPTSAEVRFFDVRQDPPRSGRPPDEQLMTIDGVVALITSTFDQRYPRLGRR